MKTLFFAAVLAVSALSANANKEVANKKATIRVTSSFEKEFGRLKDVSWDNAANNMYKATFIQDGETINAFFDEKGEFVASTIVLSSAELPYKLRNAIDKKEKDCVITEAIKMQSGIDQAYFVKVFVDGKEKVYKGYESGASFLVNL